MYPLCLSDCFLSLPHFHQLLSYLLSFVLTLYPFSQVLSPSSSVPPDGNMFIHY